MNTLSTHNVSRTVTFSPSGITTYFSASWVCSRCGTREWLSFTMRGFAPDPILPTMHADAAYCEAAQALETLARLGGKM